MLYLRLRRRALGPMRQLRQRARAGEADQSALEGRRPARTARDGAFLPGPFETGARRQEVLARTIRTYARTRDRRVVGQDRSRRTQAASDHARPGLGRA